MITLPVDQDPWPAPSPDKFALLLSTLRDQARKRSPSGLPSLFGRLAVWPTCQRSVPARGSRISGQGRRRSCLPGGSPGDSDNASPAQFLDASEHQLLYAAAIGPHTWRHDVVAIHTLPLCEKPQEDPVPPEQLRLAVRPPLDPADGKWSAPGSQTAPARSASHTLYVAAAIPMAR